MKILSVQEPWASAIVRGDKTIENRRWKTMYRGPLLIHASQKVDSDWFDRDGDFAQVLWRLKYGCEMPYSHCDDFPGWGIIGIVDLVDIVDTPQTLALTQEDRAWWVGPYGWVLRNARSLPLIACKGSLSIFDAPNEVVEQVERHLAAR